MNLNKRLVEHDFWMTERLLDRAQTLSDSDLDSPMAFPITVLGFEGEEGTLRNVLDRIVLAKEVWVAAINGRAFDFEGRDLSVAGMLVRNAEAGPAFLRLVGEIESEGKWDDLFIDALCCPPETFSFGGVVAHVLNFAAVRRTVALREFARLGHDDLGDGDPIDWDRAMTKR